MLRWGNKSNNLEYLTREEKNKRHTHTVQYMQTCVDDGRGGRFITGAAAVSHINCGNTGSDF
jgi:hypothetical protein